MNKKEQDLLVARIIDHFEHIAPIIVKESVESLSTDHPIIDYYDTDFYLAKMKGDFDDVEESLLRQLINHHIADINSIFFQHYQNARKPSAT